MGIRNRVAAGFMSVAILSSLGAATAAPANAADGVTPVCYFKKVVIDPGNWIRARVVIYNVVDKQEILQYPARTKRCFITQTKETDAVGYAPYRRVIWTGSRTVTY